jgi:hypothetical protein
MNALEERKGKKTITWSIQINGPKPETVIIQVHVPHVTADYDPLKKSLRCVTLVNSLPNSLLSVLINIILSYDLPLYPSLRSPLYFHYIGKLEPFGFGFPNEVLVHHWFTQILRKGDIIGHVNRNCALQQEFIYSPESLARIPRVRQINETCLPTCFRTDWKSFILDELPSFDFISVYQENVSRIRPYSYRCFIEEILLDDKEPGKFYLRYWNDGANSIKSRSLRDLSDELLGWIAQGSRFVIHQKTAKDYPKQLMDWEILSSYFFKVTILD